MSQRMYDEDNDAQRVVLVGGNFELTPEIKFPEQRQIEIKEIQIPVIVKEVEIREIEKPVIIKEIEIRQIENTKVVVQEKIQTVEIPVVVKEQLLQTIEKPIIVEKFSEVSKLLNRVVLLQTLVIIGLVVGLILK